MKGTTLTFNMRSGGAQDVEVKTRGNFNYQKEERGEE